MATELWKKHLNETNMNACMPKEANKKLAFIYQSHTKLDINAIEKDQIPFSMGIHTD